MSEDEKEDNVIAFPHRHGQVGYFSMGDLPQGNSVEKIAMSTGWWELDQIYRPYPGQFTVCTGIAGHGKSTFLLNMVASMARCSENGTGTRSFLYLPENEMFIREKMRRIWGDAPGWEHFVKNQCYVQSAMIESYNQPPRTLQWVLDKAVVACERDGVDLVMIDPWNELERAKNQSMPLHEYITEALMYLKQFCRALNAAVILVAHPTKAGIGDGNRTVTLTDIEGALAWQNKCDNGLIVVRDPEQNTCKVISAKVREVGAGKRGVCHFYVDPMTGRFTPQVGAVG